VVSSFIIILECWVLKFHRGTHHQVASLAPILKLRGKLPLVTHGGSGTHNQIGRKITWCLHTSNARVYLQQFCVSNDQPHPMLVWHLAAYPSSDKQTPLSHNPFCFLRSIFKSNRQAPNVTIYHFGIASPCMTLIGQASHPVLGTRSPDFGICAWSSFGILYWVWDQASGKSWRGKGRRGLITWVTGQVTLRRFLLFIGPAAPLISSQTNLATSRTPCHRLGVSLHKVVRLVVLTQSG